MKKDKTLLIVILGILLSFPANSSQAKKKTAKKPRQIEIADILAWKGIGFAGLSSDGQWFAYRISSREGHREIVIKQTKGQKEYKFKIDASGVSFTEDSQWAAFTIKPPEKQVKKLKKAKKKVYNKAGLVNLTSGEKTDFDKVKSFSFSGENSNWIALHKYPSEEQEKAKEKWIGSDLILLELSTSNKLSFGNVSEFAFDKKGHWLAWTIDAKDKSGNGIQLRNMKKGVILSLDSDKAVYKSFSWTEKGDGLTVLKGKENKDFKDKLYSLVGVRNFASDSPEKIIFDPTKQKDFPEGMTISPKRIPMWTDDLSGILFGIHQAKKKEDKEKILNQDTDVSEEDKSITDKKEEEELPDLILWHWQDKRLPPRQKVEEKADKEFNYLSVYWPQDKKFIRLADDAIKEVSPAPKHRWAIGFDAREYLRMGTLDRRVYNNIYVIDMKTGTRQLAVKKCRKFRRPRFYVLPSPRGNHFLYYNNNEGHFYTYEMRTGRKHNITKDVPTSFINTDISYNQLNPPIRPYGWSKDGKSVLLYDNWDVWQVPVCGGRGINLTLNGKKEGIRYRKRFILDSERRYQSGPDEKGIDLKGDIYFEAYGEWTKKGGIAKIEEGKPGAKILLWEDALVNTLFKAKKSDDFFYTKQTIDDFAYYITDNSLQNGIRILEKPPQQDSYLWSSGARLINFKSTNGDRLQGALYLPANYEKGKSYPTIVYIYEKRSQNLHRYLIPGFTVLSRSVYNSRGYAVFAPDIVYEVNNPGMSAVWCVLPAIEAAIETGVVDRERIGLTGHSWGGYQTAFLITQTDLFKAAVAGAPLTNLISMYSSIYGSTGNSNQGGFESSQGRIEGGYWKYFDDFVRNSPVFFAQNVNTPLLIFHCDKDGAVDFNQGIEYFNTLRRLQKPVIMLQYKGEGHHARKPPNQKDYGIRVMEFFDHYLMGKPAPKWLREGISLLEMKDHLKKRAKKKKKPD